jgi:plasmid maintenance system antidote protein VapI
MFPIKRVEPLTRDTLYRYVVDRLEDLGMTHNELADKIGITPTKLTQRIKSAGRFTPSEARIFITVLQVKDFWLDLVVPFGFGMDAFSARQLETAVKEQGYELGRINVAA